jgi:hypothetical protein
MSKIQIRRGLKSILPPLDIGEFGLCTDTNEVYIGSSAGNISLNTTKQLYYIEIDKWGIYNNGTHPTETENGINNALIWAKNNGYQGAFLKEGTYLIESTYYADPINKTGGAGIGSPYPASNRAGGERGIKPPSNFIFEMDKNCIIKMNTNNAHNYVCISIVDKDNVVIKGGKIIGDKDTHQFTFYNNYGIGGHGYGLVIERSNNIKVYDSEFSNCCGDGVLITSDVSFYRMGKNIYMKNVTCRGNARQGMSIVAGDYMLFEDCTFTETSGMSPEYGVDIECPSYSPTNIVFRRCNFSKNAKGGLINANGIKPVLEDCVFTQDLSYHPAFGIEVRNCTFTDDDGIEYRKKYPDVLTVSANYKVGDRARIDNWDASEGYTCIKAGTTGSDSSQMVRKNNYPPIDITSSMLGIIYVYGDSEWSHTDNYFTYGSRGVTPTEQPYSLNLPINLWNVNTIYAVGNQVRLSNGNSIVCTVAGMSGSSEPSTTQKYLGNTLLDGSVTWKIIDNIFPSSIRKTTTNYSEGDIVLWEDGTTWECVTSGTTASDNPSLKDLPLGTILNAPASSSHIQKINFDETAPSWQPYVSKINGDKVNINGTTWQYISGDFGGYSSGSKEPSYTDLIQGSLLTDGTVIWKKASIENHPIAESIFEECEVRNTNLYIYSPLIISKRNRVINGQYKLNGIKVFSNENLIDNPRSAKTPAPTMEVSYIFNNGKCKEDTIRNSLISITAKSDYKQQPKRVVENLFIDNSAINTNTTIFNSSLVFNNLAFTSSQLGASLLMDGGKISAYVPSNLRIFNAWIRNFSLKNVHVDVTLETGAAFLSSYTRSADGYYSNVESCTFVVTPLDNDVQLIGLSYSDSNIKLLNCNVFNTDQSKSIKINLPTTDTTNTKVYHNFFDKNVYVTDINSEWNKGGYSLRTTIESPIFPVKGDYALGTRIINSLPSVGSPKSWVVTTAGLAYSSTRANSSNYNVGDFIKWSTGSNIYECVQAGTTASTPPLAGAGIVVDGGVQWLYRGNTVATFTSEGNL